MLLFPTDSLWTRRTQTWQTFRNIFAIGLESFHSLSQKDEKKYNFWYFFKKFLWTCECSFENPAEKFPVKVRNFFAQFPEVKKKNFETRFLSQIVPMDKSNSVSTDLPNGFLVEDQNFVTQCPNLEKTGNEECSFDNTAKNSFIQSDCFLPFFRKRSKKTLFFPKDVLNQIFVCTPRVQLWPCWKVFAGRPKMFRSMAENAWKIYHYFLKKYFL